ncbi:MAG: hypothetical protein M1836_000333 [Candelina mexicana]|nr:MAG: hypothetical protein M1836_000333 [Candelina mexicana]
MPKAKQYLKVSQKKAKQRPREPESADEFLAAGVEFEEAGEKWRAGDAAKSARFFARAIENYENGLQRFPASFDLAYNKARVQYEITQHPRLSAQIPVLLVDQLRIALESHKIALKLQQDNADSLFNTAQVLTSLAEYLNDEGNSLETVQEASKLLEEALELFQRCLTVQEFQFSETHAQIDMETPESQATDFMKSDSSMEDVTGISTSGPTEDERWASIVEPVTQDTLLDTAMAQLDTLNTLCTVLAPDVRARALWSDVEATRLSRSLAWIEEYSSDLLKTKVSTYAVGSSERLNEILLGRAMFQCSLADASYRARRIDLGTYERELVSAFISEETPLNLSNDPEGLCDKAEALTTFCTSLNRFPPSDISIPHSPTSLDQLGNLAWKYLTLALESLTAASTLPTARNRAKIQLARGDVEMLRFRLSLHPLNLKLAQRSADTLIRNAQVYYRGAAGLAKNAGLMGEEKEGIVKESVAALAGGEVGKWDDLMSKGAEKAERQDLWKIIEEMLEDGLVDGALQTGQSTGRVPLSGAMEFNGGPPGESLVKEHT